jgi:hypothetical protein
VAGLTIVITSPDPDPTSRPPAYKSRYSSNSGPFLRSPSCAAFLRS